MPLFAVSIMLDNDSNYPLNAQIIDALGRHLALIPLNPGQTYLFDVSQGAFDPNTNQPYTPLTVIFLCKGARPYDYMQKKKKPNKNDIPNKSQYVNQFGIWTGVARGSYVNALGSPAGSKSCIMKKSNSKKKKRASSLSTNYGANNWSNDGGQNWTNDAGSGRGSCTEDGRACSGEVQPSSQNASPAKTASDPNAFQNDGGEDWDNDDSSPQNNSTKKNSRAKKGNSQQNDTPNSDTEHKPSKRTPMPFIERN
ncbi:MAG: hypothetical protein SP4CHLAM5_04360 [Chlamydiia bacterium]|nr:hypothetical protein [Chlamydiia bacterium]MCH9618309.1 hypothetical protein [Chlamydiia bacterium]MCH9624182.1 hypothetical protein [Chlamydiia bacterium]